MSLDWYASLHLLLFTFLYVNQELHTSFSLPTKASQFSIVQSTTTGTTTFVQYHCLHPMTFSATEVLVCKLFQYNHRQNCADTQYHIVGSYPPNHLYYTI